MSLTTRRATTTAKFERTNGGRARFVPRTRGFDDGKRDRTLVEEAVGGGRDARGREDCPRGGRKTGRVGCARRGGCARKGVWTGGRESTALTSHFPQPRRLVFRTHSATIWRRRRRRRRRPPRIKRPPAALSLFFRRPPLYFARPPADVPPSRVECAARTRLARSDLTTLGARSVYRSPTADGACTITSSARYAITNTRVRCSLLSTRAGRTNERRFLVHARALTEINRVRRRSFQPELRTTRVSVSVGTSSCGNNARTIPFLSASRTFARGRHFTWCVFRFPEQRVNRRWKNVWKLSANSFRTWTSRVRFFLSSKYNAKL